MIAISDDSNESLDSRLRLTVPDGGGLVLAATSCCDPEFITGGSTSGTYTLALRELELDLHQHIHEENNVLFPRALAVA